MHAHHHPTRAHRSASRVRNRLRGNGLEAGMATAEYAIATLAACGFAALLVAILRSSQVKALLLGVIQRALGSA